MAKIFRKARRLLLANNKLRAYLMYAFGEILLVVIGILVALQINEINQNRKRVKLEEVLLNQVRFEILATYEDVWRDTENLKLGNRSHYTIQKSISQNLPYADSLCFNFYWLKIDEYIYPTNAAYERLKGVGLDIIKNDTICSIIQGLYEGFFPRLAINNTFTPDIAQTFDDYYLHAFIPNSDLTVEFHFDFPTDTLGTEVFSGVYYTYPSIDKAIDSEYTIGFVPLDFEALKRDPKFLMLLEQTKRYRDSKLRHYASVKELMKSAINMIERDLTQRGGLKNESEL